MRSTLCLSESNDNRTPFYIAGCLALFLSVGLLPPSTWAATAYISDELTVPLRSGPSGGHRILHRGLPSGTVLEVIGDVQGKNVLIVDDFTITGGSLVSMAELLKKRGAKDIYAAGWI